MQNRIVRFEIMIPMEFPAHMDDWDINFSLNESSWCMSNLIDMLHEYEQEHGCICNICTAHVVPDGFYLKGKAHDRTGKQVGDNE